jgi:hypothetical protein
MVAEQLNLPGKVMKLFDRQDEDDDFRGVAQGSRAELQLVREMYQYIQNHRFLLVFHNGSSEEIDLASLCGFPSLCPGTQPTRCCGHSKGDSGSNHGQKLTRP